MPKISQYPSMTALTGSEILLGDQAGVTSTATGLQLATLLQTGLIAVDTGAVNTLVLNTVKPLPTIRQGTVISFFPAFSNTGPVTVSVNGGGAVAVFDSAGNALTGGEIQGPMQLQYNGAQWQLIWSLPLANKRTAVEIAQGIFPVNYAYIPGVVDRYELNVQPGTTDMGPGYNFAIKQMLAGGAPVRFLPGVYYIQTAPNYGSAVGAIQSIEIGGAGIDATQVICGVATGAHTSVQGGLFDMTGLNGVYIHDLLIAGTAINLSSQTSTNPAIVFGHAGGALTTNFRVERVLSLAAGHGVVCADTNTGVIKDFTHWPGNNPTLIVPQTVPNANRGHPLYFTGNFCHNIGMIFPIALPDVAYFGGVQRGIKCDCATSMGCYIIGGNVESLSGTNVETGLDWNPSGSTNGLTVMSLYHEGTIVSLGGVSDSEILGLTDGGVGGTLLLQNGSRQNKITANVQTVLLGPNNGDTTNYGNKLNVFARGNGTSAPAFFDYSEGANLAPITPNDLEGSWFWDGVATRFFSRLSVQQLTYSPSMTIPPLSAGNYLIRATNAVAFIVILPTTYQRNGQEIKVKIRNETLAALGAITWSGVQTPAVPPTPAGGFSREYTIKWDALFGHWYMVNWSPADVAN